MSENTIDSAAADRAAIERWEDEGGRALDPTRSDASNEAGWANRIPNGRSVDRGSVGRVNGELALRFLRNRFASPPHGGDKP